MKNLELQRDISKEKIIDKEYLKIKNDLCRQAGSDGLWCSRGVV